MRRRSAAMVAAVALLVVGACSGEDGEPEGLSTDDAAATGAPTDDPDADPEATPTDQPTSTAEATPTEEPAANPTSDDGVIAGFIDARDAFRAAYDPPNPEDPGLLAHYDGEALAGTQDELSSLVSQGHSEVIEYAHNPEVVLNDPGGAAVVEDCVEANVRTVDTDSGEDVAEPVVETRFTRYTLELRDSTWVIVQGQRLEGPCTPEA